MVLLRPRYGESVVMEPKSQVVLNVRVRGRACHPPREMASMRHGGDGDNVGPRPSASLGSEPPTDSSVRSRFAGRSSKLACPSASHEFSDLLNEKL